MPRWNSSKKPCWHFKKIWLVLLLRWIGYQHQLVARGGVHHEHHNLADHTVQSTPYCYRSLVICQSSSHQPPEPPPASCPCQQWAFRSCSSLVLSILLEVPACMHQSSCESWHPVLATPNPIHSQWGSGQDCWVASLVFTPSSALEGSCLSLLCVLQHHLAKKPTG